MTAAQRELKDKHGTPEEFASACNRAVDDLMITPSECWAGIRKYVVEWDEAGRCPKCRHTAHNQHDCIRCTCDHQGLEQLPALHSSSQFEET